MVDSSFCSFWQLQGNSLREISENIWALHCDLPRAASTAAFSPLWPEFSSFFFALSHVVGKILFVFKRTRGYSKFISADKRGVGGGGKKCTVALFRVISVFCSGFFFLLLSGNCFLSFCVFALVSGYFSPMYLRVCVYKKQVGETPYHHTREEICTIKGYVRIKRCPRVSARSIHLNILPVRVCILNMLS